MSKTKHISCQNCDHKHFWVDTFYIEEDNLWFAYVKCCNCGETNAITTSHKSEQGAIKLIDECYNIKGETKMKLFKEITFALFFWIAGFSIGMCITHLFI